VIAPEQALQAGGVHELVAHAVFLAQAHQAAQLGVEPTLAEVRDVHGRGPLQEQLFHGLAPGNDHLFALLAHIGHACSPGPFWPFVLRRLPAKARAQCLLRTFCKPGNSRVRSQSYATPALKRATIRLFQKIQFLTCFFGSLRRKMRTLAKLPELR
jgi:hypothetical protein